MTRAVAKGLHLERYVRELKAQADHRAQRALRILAEELGRVVGRLHAQGDRTRRPALGEHPGGGRESGMSHVCLSGQRADPAVRADATTEDDEEPGAVELRAGRVGESDAADAVLAGVSGGEPVATRGVEAVDSSDGCSHGAAACPAGEEERLCTLTDKGGYVVTVLAHVEAIHALPLLLAAAAVVCWHKTCYHLKVVEAGRLYRSGELGRIGLWWVWRRYGVRTIVNLVTEYECRRTAACRREQRFCQERGIEWVHLPILQGTVPDEEQIRRFVHVSLSDAAPARVGALQAGRGTHEPHGRHLSEGAVRTAE